MYHSINHVFKSGLHNKQLLQGPQSK